MKSALQPKNYWRVNHKDHKGHKDHKEYKKFSFVSFVVSTQGIRAEVESSRAEKFTTKITKSTK
jgi:hypothetical protein